MKTSSFALSPLSSILLVAAACGSDPEPPQRPPESDEAGAAGASATACIAETERVEQDDSEVCCPGLFKACVSVNEAGQKPCICSTVACGTEANQPPPNVPCCPEVESFSCQSVLGSGETICTCGSGGDGR